MSGKNAVKVDKLHILEGDGPTKAFCDIKIFGVFVVKGLRVIQGKEGLFVSMPRLQGRDDKWYDTFFPITREMRRDLEEIVLENYAERRHAS
jgi:stage V sporulation protein G